MSFKFFTLLHLMSYRQIRQDEIVEVRITAFGLPIAMVEWTYYRGRINLTGKRE